MAASDRSSRSPGPPGGPSSELARRDFLRGAAAGVGLSLLPLPRAWAAPGAEPPQVRRRVSLGSTGLELPDIGFGSSRLGDDERLVRHAFERGITYFDTAESYTRGQSETTLGKALRGIRDQVLLTSKTKCGPSTRKAELMQALEGSLRRLRTDRVDLYFNHAVNHVARLRNPEWGEFAERAKQQCKIRFSGISGHGGNLVACLEEAVERDLVDVFLVAYNYGQDPTFYQRLTRDFDFVAPQPGLPAVLDRARAKGIGVVAMKTLRGARLNDMKPYESGGASFAQAAFRWVFGSGHADALVVSMKSPQMVDEYLGASGWTREQSRDLPLLERYEALNGRSQCRYACGACHASCPHGVEVSEVLRTRMYDRDYGDLELAREDYAKLGAGAAACTSCATQACLGACPAGIEIPRLTRDAHHRLA